MPVPPQMLPFSISWIIFLRRIHHYLTSYIFYLFTVFLPPQKCRLHVDRGLFCFVFTIAFMLDPQCLDQRLNPRRNAISICWKNKRMRRKGKTGRKDIIPTPLLYPFIIHSIFFPSSFLFLLSRIFSYILPLQCHLIHLLNPLPSFVIFVGISQASQTRSSHHTRSPTSIRPYEINQIFGVLSLKDLSHYRFHVYMCDFFH